MTPLVCYIRIWAGEKEKGTTKKKVKKPRKGIIQEKKKGGRRRGSTIFGGFFGFKRLKGRLQKGGRAKTTEDKKWSTGTLLVKEPQDHVKVTNTEH